MANFEVHWGNRLESLAARMFDRLYASPWPRPLDPRCIVTNSPVMQAWLRQYFVYEWPARHGRALANCDFQLLYPFVNGLLERLLASPDDDAAPRRREPRHHPYATANLQWRICRLLEEGAADSAACAPLKAYLGASPTPARRFQLAGRLARLYDDYQIYRCNVLEQWEQGRQAAGQEWQAEIWRLLLADDPRSYAALFRAMRHARPERLRARGDDALRQVAVFGVTALPPPYVGFLQSVLATLVDVDLYVLNPSAGDWLEDVTERGVAKVRERLLLEDHPLRDDPLLLPERGHPLLCSLGQTLQEHLHILEAQTEGISDADFLPAAADSMLHDLQNRLLARAIGAPAARPADASLQVHLCHSPRREVEVLHDHLLQWFTVERLQPRQVQVLIPDIAGYAPLIDAVFGARPRQAPDAIPYAVEGRAASAGDAVAATFRALLDIAASRFTALALLDLLRCEAVAQACGLSAGELETVARLVSASGIRWGADENHRAQVSGVPMEPYATWEYGLDRLLIGYAQGSPTSLVERLSPLDLVEDETAVALGKLARCVARLAEWRETLRGERGLRAWHALLLRLLNDFFLSTNATCRQVAALRRAIDDLPALADNAGLGDRPVPFEVLREHLAATVGATAPGDNLAANAVVFCQLRPMNSRPAEVVCLLGVNDGQFPRHDNRPTFDLLAATRKRGDRSLRRDDRGAFLESLANARRRLYLSYVGRTDSDNASVPPSIVLQELRDYLAQTYQLEERRLPDGSRLLPFETLHRLRAAHPDYFAGGELFSYSQTNLMAARLLAGTHTAARAPAAAGAAPTAPAGVPDALELDTLREFFVNPARHYYRVVQGVNLSLEGPAQAGPDEELFDADALANYLLVSDLLPLLREVGFDVARLDAAALTIRAKADGLAPLGAAGDVAVTTLLEGLAQWLESAVAAGPAGSVPLRDLLTLAGRQAPAAAEIVLDTPPPRAGWRLRGACQTFSLAGAPFLVAARYASIKIRDLARAWSAHLFACASPAGAGTRTLVVGRDKSHCLAPVAAGEARRLLSALAELYAQGCAAPLPFAPESAHAYFTAAPADDEPVDDALWAAFRAWGHRDSRERVECQDIWLYHAFGDEGPMAATHAALFARAARAFFGPLQAALAEAPADAAPDGEEEP